MPNTDDDTLNEYIELKNFDNTELSLSWFYLMDNAWKTFYFNQSHFIGPGISIKYYRPETKILLNNDEEVIKLYSSNWLELDNFSYTDSIKNQEIITWHECLDCIYEDEEVIENSWSTIEEIIENTWSYIEISYFTSSWSIFSITDSQATLSWVSFIWSWLVSILYWTWDLFFSWELLDWNYNFINLNSQTQYFYQLNLLDLSWSIIQSLTWSFFTLETTSFEEDIQEIEFAASNLYYWDEDNNSKIDILEVELSKTVTWSIDLSKLKIYSNTGWLSTRLINSEIWIIDNYMLSWSSIFFHLIEQDNYKLDLKITNTTLSDLRLKSLSWAGIYDFSGTVLPDFSLTSSFNNYKNVYPKTFSNIFISNTENIASTYEIWEISQDEDIVEQNEDVIEIVDIPVSTWWWGGAISIPDIAINFQQPTYIISNSQDNVWICDWNREECKINIDLTPSFAWFSASNYSCEIDFWNWIKINSCNPSTNIMPIWIWKAIFKIYEKNNILNYKIKNIEIRNQTINLIIPEPIITIQSWLDDNNFCKNKDCSVNLTAEDSFFWNNNSKIACYWDFGWWIYTFWTENKCNPGYVRYQLGIYFIKLKIFEAWNSNNYKEKILKIINNPQWLTEEKLEEINKINVAPVAKITLQWTIWKTKKLQWNKLFCIWVKECSVNFTAEESYDLNWDKLKYYWDFWNWNIDFSQNPKSIKYLSWSFFVKLKVEDQLGLYWEDYFEIYFIPKNDTELKIKEELVEEKEPTFSQLLSMLFSEISDEIKFEETLDDLFILAENELNYFNTSKIKLSTKLNQKSYFKNWKIYCEIQKSCKLNFWIEWEKIWWAKYLWKINNEIFWDWFNPKIYEFMPWIYELELVIIDTALWEKIQKIKIIVKKHIKVSKTPKKSNKNIKDKENFSIIIPTKIINNVDNQQKEIPIKKEIPVLFSVFSLFLGSSISFFYKFSIFFVD